MANCCRAVLYIRVRNPKVFHQLSATDQDFLLAHLRNESFSATIFRLIGNKQFHFQEISFLVGLQDGFRNGMRGTVFRFGCNRKNFLFRNAFRRIYLFYDKIPFRQCSGLIRNKNSQFGHELQIIGALHQDSFSGCRTDAAEKRKRHGNHECTGTGNNQECARTIKPNHRRVKLPYLSRKYTKKNADKKKEIRHNSERKCGEDHNRRIDLGKTRDEVLRPGLLLRCLFHKFQNLRNGRILKALCCFDAEQSLSVDTAGDDALPRFYGTGHGLSGQRRRIHHAFTTLHHAVNRNLLSRLNQKNISDFHFVRIYRFYAAILPLHIRILRHDIHQFLNGGTASSHCIALKEFPYLIENHDGYRLCKLSGKKCTNRRDRHKEGFIKRSPVLYPQETFPQHLITAQKIRNQKQGKKVKRVRIEKRNTFSLLYNHQKHKDNERYHKPISFSFQFLRHTSPSVPLLSIPARFRQVYPTRPFSIPYSTLNIKPHS